MRCREVARRGAAWHGVAWCAMAWHGVSWRDADVACARAVPPVGRWHPYLARAVCSVRFEFTTPLGRKIYGALLKAIQTRTGPFGTPLGSMACFATRFACVIWATLPAASRPSPLSFSLLLSTEVYRHRQRSLVLRFFLSSDPCPLRRAF